MRRSEKGSAESATGKLPEVHGEIVPWEGGLPAGRPGNRCRLKATMEPT